LGGRRNGAKLGERWVLKLKFAVLRLKAELGPSGHRHTSLKLGEPFKVQQF
jgi:hypothetical protein